MNEDAASEISLQPTEGWHCSHLYYRFDRARLAALSSEDKAAGIPELMAILSGEASGSPAQMQLQITPGHKADFGIMALDPDPLLVNGLHQRILGCRLGVAIVPTYSFLSVTEVSEYVPTVERYAARLVQEGVAKDSDAYNAKVDAYAKREVFMRKQRLTPDLPPWPNMCFYPMNKIRHPAANWYTIPWDERNELMAEHGRTGMTFGGKVTQLITVSFGFDDWEWGVTLWAKRPDYLKDIVYRMRFDEASAKYAEFGPFYVGYHTTPEELLKHCGLHS
jgi:chlorite dismutase